MVVAIDTLREQTKTAEAVRDVLVRELRQEGYSAIKLASLMNMDRSRVYQILYALPPEADDSEFADMAERIEDAWQEACQLWFSCNDPTKTPDDFFPLERLLARRA